MVKFAGFLGAAALIFGANAAMAEPPSEFAERVMDTCRPDSYRLCPNVPPGGGRVTRCLLDRERDLSPACLRGLKIAYAIEVCKPEYKRLCRDVPEGARGLECLMARFQALPAECQRVVTASAAYLGRGGERYSSYPGPGPAYPYSGPGYPGTGPGSPYADGNPMPPRYGAPYAQPYPSPYPDSPRDRGYPNAGPGPYGAPPYSDRPGYAERPPYGDRPPSDGQYADRDYDRPRFQPYGEPPQYGPRPNSGQSPYGQQPDGGAPYPDGGYDNDGPGSYPQDDRAPPR